jgi:hypothetical protein
MIVYRNVPNPFHYMRSSTVPGTSQTSFRSVESYRTMKNHPTTTNSMAVDPGTCIFDTDPETACKVGVGLVVMFDVVVVL